MSATYCFDTDINTSEAQIVFRSIFAENCICVVVKIGDSESLDAHMGAEINGITFCHKGCVLSSLYISITGH